MESRDGRRVPYAATLDYSTYYDQAYYEQLLQYDIGQQQQQQQQRSYRSHRRVRSASPEMLRGCTSPDYYYESDSSSTSGDEGTHMLISRIFLCI